MTAKRYMMYAHPEIEADLAYSEKLHGLTAGHQQETNQLLQNMKQLQGDARILLDENNELREANAAKDARIAELEARVAELEARPNIVTDTYFENFNAEKVIQFPQQPIGKRKKAKYIEDTNQLFLELWKEKATAI